MKKLKSFTVSGLLYATVLGTALVALGIGFSMTSPSGEQSKISYEGNLWCVSNYIEARDDQGQPVYLEDGRPRKDERLDDKTALIRKEQVSAETKEEAEKKAKENGHGLFEPSDAERLREALDKGDEEFFKTHFNTGATAPGPCIGSGTGSGTIGSWSSQNIAEKCGLINQSTEFEIVKKIRVNLTTYCPCLPSTGNNCDCRNYGGQPMGGNETSADPTGMFKVVNGRLSWVKHSTKEVEKYVFAEPQTNNIVPWKERTHLPVVIPGFNDNQPIYIRDHYGETMHLNKNFLDLFAPCDEWGPVSSAIKSLSHATGGEGHAFAEVDAYIVDTNKPVSKTTAQTSNTLPDSTPCPESIEPKPADGEDYQAQLAKAYEAEMSKYDEASMEESSNSTGASDTEGTTGSSEAGSSSEESNVNYGSLPSGILDVPAIDPSKYGMIGECNRVAAGMAYAYRTGKSINSKLIQFIKTAGGNSSSATILKGVGTGVVDRRRVCASSNNWSEIRDQVVNKKNPVVLATGFGGSGRHYITIVGFKGDRVYFNDGDHFVGSGTGIKARSIAISEINKRLSHRDDKCRYLYAK